MPAYNLTPFHARMFRIGAAMLVPVALCACQGLTELMGVTPTATAPATVNIGNLVAGRGNSLEKLLSGSRMDLSGDTGAEGDGAQAQDATQTIDPDAVGKAITDAAKTFVAPGAVTLLDAAQSELANGDAESANRLLKKAQAAEKAAADAKKAAEAPKDPPVEPQ